VEEFACDSVILCTARRSNDALYRGLKARESEWAAHGLSGVHRAGDCLAPRYLADAVFDGHRLAREFDDADPERPRAIIRERPLWGGETFPKLGDRVL
jgi:dimethylamine/trimethylamine dehydrogenase